MLRCRAAGKGSNGFSKNCPSSCQTRQLNSQPPRKFQAGEGLSRGGEEGPKSTQSSYLGWQPGTKPVEVRKSLENDISFQSADSVFRSLAQCCSGQSEGDELDQC